MCLYDFTNKILVLDMLVFRPNIDICTYVISDYFVLEEASNQGEKNLDQTFNCDLDGLGETDEPLVKSNKGGTLDLMLEEEKMEPDSPVLEAPKNVQPL